MRRMLACLFLIFVAPGAVAQDSMYAGLGYGEFDYEEQFLDSILGKVSDSVPAYKIFGGFEFNDYFALEISYGKSDSIVDSASGVDPMAGAFFYQLDLEFTTTTLRAVGQVPFDSIALIGGLGYFSVDGDIDNFFDLECCGPFATEASLSDNGMTAQLGVEWRFGRFGARYALRLEYEWWDMSNVDASTTGLAFSYGF